jgi:hypothetical protein
MHLTHLTHRVNWRRPLNERSTENDAADITLLLLGKLWKHFKYVVLLPEFEDIGMQGHGTLSTLRGREGCEPHAGRRFLTFMGGGGGGGGGGKLSDTKNLFGFRINRDFLSDRRILIKLSQIPDLAAVSYLIMDLL